MPPRKRRSAKSPSSSAGKKSPVVTEGSAPVLAVDESKKKRWKSWKTRVFYSWIMVLGAIGLILVTKQLGCALLIFAVQVGMYMEIVKLVRRKHKEDQVPGFWGFYIYWFFLGVFFSWGHALRPHLLKHSFTDSLGFSMHDALLIHFELIAFLLYIAGIVAFVLSLQKRKMFGYQFQQLAYCHCTVLAIVVQGSFAVKNLFNGLIWFMMPISQVVSNDVFAYITGFFIGRTPLIKLSPKKTWEGFIGGGIATIVIAIVFTRLLSDPYFDPFTALGLSESPIVAPLMCCPVEGFPDVFSVGVPKCQLPNVYRPVALVSYPSIASYIPQQLQGLTISPIQFHAVILAVFASVVGPFGGFFASGLKRALKVKDFNDVVPGHGGVVDRMDCQLIMGLFAYVYFVSAIAPLHPNDMIAKAMVLLKKALPEAEMEKVSQIISEVLSQGTGS